MLNAIDAAQEAEDDRSGNAASSDGTRLPSSPPTVKQLNYLMDLERKTQLEADARARVNIRACSYEISRLRGIWDEHAAVQADRTARQQNLRHRKGKGKH